MIEELRSLENGRVLVEPSVLFPHGGIDKSRLKWVPTTPQQGMINLLSTPGSYGFQVPIAFIKNIRLLPDEAGIKQGVIVLNDHFFYTGKVFRRIPTRRRFRRCR